MCGPEVMSSRQRWVGSLVVTAGMAPLSTSSVLDTQASCIFRLPVRNRHTAGPALRALP